MKSEQQPAKSGARYDNLSPDAAAQKMIPMTTGATIKGDQKFDPFAWVVVLVFVFVIPIGYLYLVAKTVDKSASAASARATAHAQGTVFYQGVKALPTATRPPWMGRDGSVYLTATLPPRTQEPTKTPTPSTTPSPAPTQPGIIAPQEFGYFPGYGQYYFMFSRYYPPLLGASCHPDNVLTDGTCKDITSSGEKWSAWLFDKTANKNYRGGVAVPMTYPLGIVIRVSYPESMRGDYLAVDYCPACDDYPGVTFIDFLSESQIVPYWTPIKSEIVR